MKAISVRQPWAWAIVQGLKPVENRSWNTHFRGQVAIHASLTFDRDGYRWMCEHAEELQIALGKLVAEKMGWPLLPQPGDFDRGGVVGFADVVDCVDELDSPWFCGPKGHVLENPIPCELIPMKGRLQYFEIGSAAFGAKLPEAGVKRDA